LQRNFSIKVYQLKVKEALRETDKGVRPARCQRHCFHVLLADNNPRDRRGDMAVVD
jgi:hypothetical protein